MSLGTNGDSFELPARLKKLKGRFQLGNHPLIDWQLEISRIQVAKRYPARDFALQAGLIREVKWRQFRLKSLFANKFYMVINADQLIGFAEGRWLKIIRRVEVL